MDTERCIAMFIRDVLFLDQDPQALAAKSSKNVRAPSTTPAGGPAGSFPYAYSTSANTARSSTSRPATGSRSRLLFNVTVARESAGSACTAKPRRERRSGSPVSTELKHAQAIFPSELSTELPSCPVCLERLDISKTGMMTTVCNHSFHCRCLSDWTDSSCPVCRYSQEPDRKDVFCSVCGATESLWMCVVCGSFPCFPPHEYPRSFLVHAPEIGGMTRFPRCAATGRSDVGGTMASTLSSTSAPLATPFRLSSTRRHAP